MEVLGIYIYIYTHFLWVHSNLGVLPSEHQVFRIVLIVLHCSGMVGGGSKNFGFMSCEWRFRGVFLRGCFAADVVLGILFRFLSTGFTYRSASK